MGGSPGTGGMGGMVATGGAGGAGAMGGAPTGGTGGGGGMPPTGDINLTGTWATETVVTSSVMGFMLESRQYFLSEIEQNGTNVRYSTRICEYELPSVPNVATIIIPQALQTLIQSKVVTSEGPFLSGLTFGSTLTPDPQVVVLGANLANPATDPMPTMADLTNAVDEDGDSNPGVTIDADVLICLGIQQLYVALRTEAALTGTVDNNDIITGVANANIEQSVLGLSDPCLNLSSQVMIDVVPGSPFRQVRVDGTTGGPNFDTNSDGSVDCAELNANRGNIF